MVSGFQADAYAKLHSRLPLRALRPINRILIEGAVFLVTNVPLSLFIVGTSIAVASVRANKKNGFLEAFSGNPN